MLDVGQPAPDFTLKTLSGKAKHTLSSFKGQKPVALIFGSYTCPPFRSSAGRLRDLYAKHGKDVQFFVVYITEAHALDGRAPMNRPGSPLVEEPMTWVERCST